MPDIKVIEGRLDYVRATMGAQHRFSIDQDELRDLLAYVRELKEALAPLVEFFNGPCRLDSDGFCQHHDMFTIDGECPVARARRLLS